MAMKFLHLGDLHLGKYLCEFSLLDDQKYILNQIVEMAKEEQADGVLLAGDIYDRPVPNEEAVDLLYQFLLRLKENGIRTFLISGNHDSEKRLDFGTKFFEAGGVYICARYDGTLYKRTFEDNGKKVNIFLLPFVKASMVKNFYPDEIEDNNYESAVRVILNHADIDPSECNILVSHQFVVGEGGETPVLDGSESLQTREVGTVEQIGSSLFDDFAYVALGHIHLPQKVGRETIRYSGSILKYSKSEIRHKKSVPVITTGDDGSVSVKFLELKPKREVRVLEGRMAEILAAGKEDEHRDDYVYVILHDEEIIPDGMLVMQHTYPNTLKISYENSHTRELVSQSLENGADVDLSFEEIVKKFYSEMYGSEISDEEMEILLAAAREVAICDETD